MTPHQIRAMYLAARILKHMYSRLDEGASWQSACHALARYNFVHRIAFPGITRDVTPGEMIDSYIETRVFEARF